MPTSFVTLLVDVLKEQGSYVLASCEDADFFRKALRSKESPSKSAEQRSEKPVVLLQKQNQHDSIDIPKAKMSEKHRDDESCQDFKQELGQRDSQNFFSEQAPITERQDTSENNNKPRSDFDIKREKPITPNSRQKTIHHFSFLRQIVKTASLELKIIDEIPSDAIAQKISERWKTKNKSAPISILVFQEPPEQRALLEQIAKALDIYFGFTKIVFAEEIEKQKQWDSFLSSSTLKLILTCDYTLWQLSNLLQFYKETPAKAERLLANVPLFLLPDLSLYLKDPLLKRSLWKALCQILQ